MFTDNVMVQWRARYGYKPSKQVLKVLRLLDEYMAAGGSLDAIEMMLDNAGGAMV